MAQARAECLIQVPAERVWDVIGRFGDLGWYHGVSSCHLDGPTRTVTTLRRPNLDVDELEIHHSDHQRTYSYALTDLRGDTVIRRHDGDNFDSRDLIGHLRATIKVEPQTVDSCLVTYELEMDEGHDATIATTIAGYQACIDHLKYELEIPKSAK